MKFSRHTTKPNKNTFSMAPLKKLTDSYMRKVSRLGGETSKCSPAKVLDPFARECKIGTWTNDINPNMPTDMNLDAIQFLQHPETQKRAPFDIVLFDPPFSPTQAKRAYEEAGLEFTQTDSQDGRMRKQARDEFLKLTKSGSFIICCAFNSTGMGKYAELVEVMLLNHSGGHNDTIITVWKIRNKITDYCSLA
jgi:hypothetical protein